MKRLLIIIVGFFIIVALIILFFVFQKPKQNELAVPTPTPVTTLLPKPTFPDVSAFLPEPSYALGPISGAFPSSLPVYTPAPTPETQGEISRIANIFSIKAQPTANTAVDGTYYIWSSDPGLIIGPNTQHIDYSASGPTSNSLLDADSVFVLTGQQLVSFVVRWYPIISTSTLYFAPQNTDLNFVARQNAKAIQITYLPTLGELPIISGAPKLSETIVRYNAAKTLLYYSGYVYPQFIKTPQSTPIVSLQEAETRLLSGEGSILSASSQSDINAHDTKWYQFSLTTITQASLAYYYNFANKQLSPVFLFTGTATDKSTGKTVDTVSAVSATP